MTEKRKCYATGCKKEGIIPMYMLGEPDVYYCEMHAKEMKDFLERFDKEKNK